jgi:hypothetical protein
MYGEQFLSGGDYLASCRVALSVDVAGVATRCFKLGGATMNACRVVAALMMLSLAILLPAAPASAAADLLPDLGMARLRDIKIQNTADGRRLLRFSTVVVNVGEGPFEVRGRRPDTTAPDMTTEQRIFDDAGNSRYVSTPATIIFAGDGHNHWHVWNLQHYELNRLDNGVKVGTGAKSGFCFFDNEIFGALTDPVYTGQNSCRGGSSALQTTMGLSGRWGDLYSANLFGQYIDITGLASGQYRLSVTADLDNWFLETDDFNNSSWVDIQLTGNGLTIQGYGAFATPPTGGNLLKNRRFELATNNRPANWTSNSKFTRSNEVVFEGSYAGKHFATDDSGYTISQNVFNLTENTTYTFSGYVNIPHHSDSNGFTFTLSVTWRNAKNKSISTETINIYTDTTSGAWDQVTRDLVAPAGTTHAVARMIVSSLNATIYVDNFLFGPS